MSRLAAPAQGELADIDEDEEDEDADDGSAEDADSLARLIHDVSYVPSYPSKSTRSGLIHSGGVEIALCSPWMKQRILLSLFGPFTGWNSAFTAARPA